MPCRVTVRHCWVEETGEVAQIMPLMWLDGKVQSSSPYPTIEQALALWHR